MSWSKRVRMYDSTDKLLKIVFVLYYKEKWRHIQSASILKSYTILLLDVGVIEEEPVAFCAHLETLYIIVDCKENRLA